MFKFVSLARTFIQQTCLINGSCALAILILCFRCLLIQFRSMFHFYTSCKRQKNQRFSDVFRSYRNGTSI